MTYRYHAPLIAIVLFLICPNSGAGDRGGPEFPSNLRIVLENTKPLTFQRGKHLPLFLLPISDALRELPPDRTEEVLRHLEARGIAYTVSWNQNDRTKALNEGLRIGLLARKVGLPVAVDASSCLYGFFDGSESTLHIDDQGRPFADLSFDPARKMGCPFALAGRVDATRKRIEFFLDGYSRAKVRVDFAFADWEIDGPIEWNDAWANSKKCRRCREHFHDLNDFRSFQRQVREIRSDLQRRAFSEPLISHFPRVLVGNYGVYPHGGYRYWYDYYERAPIGVPLLSDQRARYREWAHEFDPCGFTVAMPVVYTWYPIYGWYDFPNTDYRWFYNGLLNGSDVGRHTKASTPIITFVHRATTAPPAAPDPSVKPFNPEAYQELLWHLLLRGHDDFFLWCLPNELAEETKLLHEVYSSCLEYREFLEHGKPVSFEVPEVAGPFISGLRLGNRVLVRRTDFNPDRGTVRLKIGNRQLEIPPGKTGCQIFTLR